MDVEDDTDGSIFTSGIAGQLYRRCFADAARLYPGDYTAIRDVARVETARALGSVKAYEEAYLTIEAVCDELMDKLKLEDELRKSAFSLF